MTILTFRINWNTPQHNLTTAKINLNKLNLTFTHVSSHYLKVNKISNIFISHMMNKSERTLWLTETFYSVNLKKINANLTEKRVSMCIKNAMQTLLHVKDLNNIWREPQNLQNLMKEIVQLNQIPAAPTINNATLN